MKNPKTYLGILLLAAGLLALLYGRVATVYFCGFDDFAEVYRAQFEDDQDPRGIFTKTHFGTSKYRPVHRALTYFTWKWGGGSAFWFRLRNLVFHWLLACCLFGISGLLFGHWPAAAAAALLFAVHPLTNQSVLVAVWAVTAAYAFLFGSFFFFLCALHFPARRLLLVSASLLLATLGLFTYEPVIVVFAWMAAYLALWRWRGREAPKSFLLAWCGGSALILGVFLALRLSVVSQPARLTPLPALLKNLLLYLGALASPYDFVFGHAVFGSPLPSQLRFGPLVILSAVLAALVCLLLILWLARRPGFRRRFAALPWPECALTALLFPALLSPYLVFTDHASETYLYSPVAIFAILAPLFLATVVPRRQIFTALLALWLLVLCAATWTRSGRVVACGLTAGQILQNLPIRDWRAGQPTVYLASPPNTPPLNRYGIYGYRGLSTIDARDPFIPAAEWAIRIAARNPKLRVQVVDPDQLRCQPPAASFRVYDSGAVRDICQP